MSLLLCCPCYLLPQFALPILVACLGPYEDMDPILDSLQTLKPEATAVTSPLTEADLDEVLQGYTTSSVGFRPWNYFDGPGKMKLLEAMQAGDQSIKRVYKRWATVGQRIEHVFAKKA